MPESDLQLIDLGPGGLIRNVKANEELLEKIGRTDPLPTPDLLYLANFFRRYIINFPLGEHLELVGLRQIIYKEEVQQYLKQAGSTASAFSAQDPLENFEAEDWLPFYGDNAQDESNEKDTFTYNRQFEQVKWISFSRVGLLIDIVYYKTKDDTKKKRYYVIGISPKPPQIPTEVKA